MVCLLAQVRVAISRLVDILDIDVNESFDFLTCQLRFNGSLKLLEESTFAFERSKYFIRLDV